MSKDDILQTLKEQKEYIQKTYEVERIGLFGSYAKDKQNCESDIDIYVEFKNKTFKNIAGLWVYLEELYHTKVDLVHKHKRIKSVMLEAIQKDIIYG